MRRVAIDDGVGAPFVVNDLLPARRLPEGARERFLVEHVRLAMERGARVTWPYLGPVTLVLP